MGGAWNAMDFQTKHLGVETGKSFPCVQALADRRALMTKLEHRNFHGRHCEHTTLLVPGGSWIRVEHNTFWIALFCFRLPDFVSESLVSIEGRPSTRNAWSKSIVFNVSQKHLALRLCHAALLYTFAESEHRLGKGSRVLLSRAHLQFESSRFEVVQLIIVYIKRHKVEFQHRFFFNLFQVPQHFQVPQNTWTLFVGSMSLISFI